MSQLPVARESAQGESTTLEDLVLERSGLAWSISTTHDDGSRHYWFSSAFLELTGYETADFERHGFRLLQGPLTDPDAFERATEVRRGGGALELVLHRADGSPFWDRMSISPVMSAGDPTWLTLHEDVTSEEDDEGRGALIERLRKAQWRGELLSRVFEEISGSMDQQEIFRRVLALTVPEFADWACVTRYSGAEHPVGGLSLLAVRGGRPDTADAKQCHPLSIATGDVVPTIRRTPECLLVPHVTEEWLSQIVVLEEYPPGRQLVGASLIAVPIHGFATSYGALTQVTFGRPYTEEDFEAAKVIGSQLGILVENVERSRADSERMETIETAVFAPPAQFPGLDVAVEASPPAPSDPYVSWCDAFPLSDGVEGFVISQIYGTGMAATENVAMQRASVRALLWADRDPRAALQGIAEFAYAMSPDPLASSGHIATVSPDGSGVVLEVASVAQPPVAVREPGRGFRILVGERCGAVGTAGVPIASTQERLPRGSVLFFLSDAALGGLSGSVSDDMGYLFEAWGALPEDAPAGAYAQIIREQALKMLWKRNLCFLVVRVPPA